MRKILSLLVFLCLAGCAAYAMPASQPDQIETLQSETPTPVSGPETPPIVLNTSPEPGAEQPLEAPIEITFDQPMDRASVERAFAIEPGDTVDGEFEWVDDRTVRFAFDDGFKPDTRYKVRVVTKAESETGLTMQHPFELRFSSVGFLEVTNVQPADGTSEVLPDTIVTVMFNRPVVPLNAIEDAAGLPDPLTFVPPVSGEGEWLNTSIYRFTPAEPGFTPATEYTARVGAGLEDALGVTSLQDEFEWSFSTVSPAAIGSIPAGGDRYVSPTPVISVTFNQPMDRESVEQNLSLTNNETTEVISGSFSWLDRGLKLPQEEEYTYYSYKYDEGEGPEEIGVETVRFTPDKALDAGISYTIELPKGTEGDIDRAETQADYTARFTVAPEPEIIDTNPNDGEEQVSPWRGGLELTFNTPINRKTLVYGENLLIDPPVTATEVYSYWWENSTNVNINFPFEASSGYTVTIGEGLEDRYGRSLSPTTIAWQTGAESPILLLNTPGRVAFYNAYTNTLIYATVRNITGADFGLYRMPRTDFISLNNNNWWDAWEEYQPDEDNLIAEWQLENDSELNSSILYELDLGQKSGLGDRLPPGLYYLEGSVSGVYPEAELTGPPPSPEKYILVVSRYNLTFKTSPDEALAWLTDLESGQPVGDVPITVQIHDDTEEAATGDDGVARADYTVRRDSYIPRFAFAGDPDDPGEDFSAAVSSWAGGIERYQFDNVNVEDYPQPYNAHLYTDRNIYRPGQTVHFKGILRADDDAHYSLPTEQTIGIAVFDSQGKMILSEELSLSEMGTFNGSIELDENAALGFYNIEAHYKDYYFYDDFQVAAYRKPEFLVEVATDKPEYAQGEDVNVTASAEFYFGGPVSNAEVRWTLLSDDYIFRYDGDEFYDFTDYDFSRRYMGDYYGGFGERIAEGEGVTDAEGRFTFEVEADIADKIASQRYTFDVVVTDLNNQEVAAQAGAIIHKGNFYIGLRPERYVGRVNNETEMNVLVVDWESQPVADQEVQLVFAEHNWYSVQKQYEDGSYYWESEVEDVPVMTTTVTTDRDGRAMAAFTPETGGVFKIFASGLDRAGNEVRSSTYMWISGREYVNWRQENNDRIDLVADKREYDVGDTATILVPHPYSGTVQALVTLERGHIYDHFVTELETNSDQLEIEITEDMIPNMYVSVVVVKGMDESDPLPSFKVGYASLPINVAEKQLNITLTPNKEAKYQPRETVEFQVNVTDQAGEPVEAELSLALVDKAVLALSPETPGQLLDTFWRNRGLGVQTGGGLTLAIDRINIQLAPAAKGGGGGFDEGFGIIRGEFKDTALWRADVRTDANGQATVETTLPDNLTTWTLTGKGVTGADTLVGESRVEIVSTKPLLVRPVAPRFFVVGDEARLGMIVQNNTEESLEVETRLEAEGLTVEPVQADPMLELAAGERVKVEYNVTVQDVAQIELTMGAKSGGYGDAVAFELPVYRFSTPETVATVGVMEEDGTRVEAVALPRSFDPTQGQLKVSIDPSLAAGMRDSLDYLEHFPYECTEQTVSRFLPNIVTYRAYQQLNMAALEDSHAAKLEARLPGLVSLALQRLYNQQHIDGGWGWWVNDNSNPYLTAYILLGMVEARRADFSVDQDVINQAVDYLETRLAAPKDIEAAWKANRQAFILYALAEAGEGDLGRSLALFEKRQALDIFGRAYLAMTIHLLDEEADQIETLLNDITSEAITSASGAHWEEAQVDYYAMNTDTRSTAIVIAALSRLQPDHPLLPNAVRWLMTVRENGGHWETTQETAWAVIGLTDWMVASGELEGNYRWQVILNGDELGNGEVDLANIDETTQLQVEVAQLMADNVNRLAIERNPVGEAVSGSPGNLYYGLYLTYYKPVPEVKALDRGIIVTRRYRLADDDSSRSISEAEVGDVIEVRLTVIAPNDLHYVVVEDPFPAGTEAIDTSLATTSAVGEAPEIERTDRGSPWGPAYGWWYFSHTELRDEKAVLFSSYLPKGTYEYTYQVRASLPGEFRVIPTHAEEMYFPEVFGRSDGGLFRIEQ